MQLNKIKLSGFKSFVDPTTVLLPSHLVAVVGPNGCGKSNIIDAISWVMGESSAKQLRGELLTDVIFNGSSTRKPIGQASVELLFDNQDGSIGGEYSNYAEISIKRQISRSGDSSYFLNNTRCRRRDIIDIFLGTGLGPRSYSIIGQNMISRVIEAKPDDMRNYLEEAAGVSKYKERRRETENRIGHTKDNLARLNDLRSELEKQLNTLNRQASAAERFKTLKQEERVIRGQSYAIQWRQLDTRLVQYSLQIQQQETGAEARHTEIMEIDASMELKREEQHLASEAFHEVQRKYYVAGNDITRMEQDIRHHQERQQQWQNDLAQVEQNYQEGAEQLAGLEEELSELTEEITQIEPEVAAAAVTNQQAVDALEAAEDAVLTWQSNWDAFNQSSAQSAQTAEVQQTRIQHLEQKIKGLNQRQAQLQQEQAQFNFSELESEITNLSEETQAAQLTTEEQNTRLNQIREKIASLQTEQQQITAALDTLRSELQRQRGQQASLEALQQTALGQRDNLQVEWLTQNNLDKMPRLAQGIEVESGWENALEKVLGSYLQAVCVDKISDVAKSVANFSDGSLSIFAAEVNRHGTPEGYTKAPTLLGKIKSSYPLDSLLGGVYVADNLAAALALTDKLTSQESVITADGVWLNASWLRLSREENAAAGVFQREQELKQLSSAILAQETEQTKLESQLENCREQLAQLEAQREQLQQTANECHTRSAEAHAREKMQRERLLDLKQRADKVTNDLTDAAMQYEEAQTELSSARSLWEAALTELEQMAEKRENLTKERELTREKLQAARDNVRLTKDATSELQIRLQTSLSQQASSKQTMAHMQSQLAILNKRKTALQNDLASAQSLTELEQTLSIALEQRLSIEAQLNTARTTMENMEQEVRALESKRQAIERELSKIRDVLETMRLESNSLKVKSENLSEQLSELSMTVEENISTLPEDATADAWQAQLEQITQRINRLGPINLVAIEEYATCSERKEYLDKQYNDLTEGLATLESAIEKIDKETRARFKETFDKVNERFQELFPTIFGGGKAYLELTGDNLLDAGVTVMACPPGKRNSTIQLLSGGEKALTAISLVFSIFHLNPAPFCLLDEVDAPLDDANIGRFCNLVKTMSEKTQFIFISHNKLAIEMAKHLIGVTMHEPGVSRLVSVNVEEAISLAGA
jgi:chromosome segregation protein